MNTNKQKLEARVKEERLEREESVMMQLFDAFRDEEGADDPKTAQDFDGLYRELEGLTLEKQDNILYWVTLLCRDHEKCGFERGIKLGAKLKEEQG